MDPVDLDERILAQTASFRHAEAMLLEAAARQAYAGSQARRYEQLFATHAVSEEALAAKRQELQVADAALTAAQADLARARSERAAMGAQRSNLRLVAPVDGVVVLRNADPGTTVVAGQAVVEVIDPASLWINVRFDQSSASGLAAGLAARIVLRSRADQSLAGHVLRLEPKADAVTEEILAKVGFDVLPELLPPVGELVEVTVDLPALPTAAGDSELRCAPGRRQGRRLAASSTATCALRPSGSEPPISMAECRCARDSRLASRWSCTARRR